MVEGILSVGEGQNRSGTLESPDLNKGAARTRISKYVTEQSFLDTSKNYHTQSQIERLIKFPKEHTLYMEQVSIVTSCFGLWKYDIDFYNNKRWFRYAYEATKLNVECEILDDQLENRDVYFESKDIDLILKKASQTDRDILIVVTPGFLFHDQIAMHGIWPYMELYKDTLLFGKLCDDNHKRKERDWYWNIHPAIFAINLKIYRDLGCPKFSNFEYDVVDSGIRSEDDMVPNSNYTPYWIKPSSKNINTKSLKGSHATNLIATGLSNGYDVRNIGWPIREVSNFMYADDQEKREQLELAHRYISLRKHEGWNNIFWTNTEGLTNFEDGVGVSYYKDIHTDLLESFQHYTSVEDVLEKHYIDSFCCVASGFLSEWYYHRFKLYDLQEICLYDINTAGLNYKNWLYRSWNGPKDKSLGDHVRSTYEKVPEFFNVILSDWRQDFDFLTEHINRLDNDMNNTFDSVWKTFKDLPKTFFPLNIVDGPKFIDAFNMFRRDNYQLVMISNIWHNKVMMNDCNYDHNKLKNKLMKIIDAFPKKTIILGDCQLLNTNCNMIIKE